MHPYSFRKNSLEKAIEIEMEHAETIKRVLANPQDYSIEKVAEMIAKDHIKEDPEYYPKLIKAGL